MNNNTAIGVNRIDNIIVGNVVGHCNYSKCKSNFINYKKDSFTCFGYHAISLDDYSVAIGEHATVKTANSIAIGPKTVVTHKNCIVIGNDIESEHNNSVKIGNLEYHNDSLRISDKLQIIGNTQDAFCDACLQKMECGIKFKYSTDSIQYNNICLKCIFDCTIHFKAKERWNSNVVDIKEQRLKQMEANILELQQLLKK